ncbi:MAG: hypothetical protein R2873_08565 [Caldilineaceae bacterium]
MSVLLLLLGGVAILLSGFGGQYVDRPSYQRSKAGNADVVRSFGRAGHGAAVCGQREYSDRHLDVGAHGHPRAGPQCHRTPDTPGRKWPQPSWLSVNRAQGLSLIGALLLLVGLLPAGPGGPAQPLQGGVLPVETILMLLIAAAIRAGAYPFHVWLLPANAVRLPLPDRFGDHLVPAVCGLWLSAGLRDWAVHRCWCSRNS